MTITQNDFKVFPSSFILFLTYHIDVLTSADQYRDIVCCAAFIVPLGVYVFAHVHVICAIKFFLSKTERKSKISFFFFYQKCSAEYTHKHKLNCFEETKKENTNTKLCTAHQCCYLFVFLRLTKRKKQKKKNYH